MKKAAVIGLGNITLGDLGAGCYVVDALLQEPLGEYVDATYLAEASFYAGAFICGSEFAVIVQAVCLGGTPGSIYCWDNPTFQRNFHWFADQSLSIRSLGGGFARAGLSEIFPDDLMFLWIEPAVTEGVAISSQMRSAIRKAINLIKKTLFQRGFLPESALELSSIHHLEILDATV